MENKKVLYGGLGLLAAFGIGYGLYSWRKSSEQKALLAKEGGLSKQQVDVLAKRADSSTAPPRTALPPDPSTLPATQFEFMGPDGLVHGAQDVEALRGLMKMVLSQPGAPPVSDYVMKETLIRLPGDKTWRKAGDTTVFASSALAMPAPLPPAMAQAVNATMNAANVAVNQAAMNANQANTSMSPGGDSGTPITLYSQPNINQVGAARLANSAWARRKFYN